MARSFRLLAIASLVLWAWGSVPGDAQQPQQQPSSPPQQPASPAQPDQPNANPQQPVFRAGINYVRVDVIVSDKNGNQVSDLKQSDFEVFEDNKPQTIDAFKLIKLDGGAVPGPDGPPRAIRTDSDEEQEAARDDVRLFAIFLDDYHVRRETSIQVRNPLSSFVQTQLGPSDMIGLMYPLEPVSSVRMTRNHDAIVGGVQQFLGRKYDYQPRNQFEEQYARYPTEMVERVRNDVSLSAIKGLITHMGSLKEGRKSLIVVSEGYSNMLPPQLRDPNASMPGLGNPNRLDPNAGQNDTTEDRAAFLANTDLQMDLRDVYDTANHFNVSLYMLDPRGLAVGEFDIEQNINSRISQTYLNASQDSLRVLADQTDGRAIVNRNDLAGGLRQITRDASAYYLLGYNSTQAPADGKFHAIRVRVKRPGIQVRARKGYWALTPDDVARIKAGPKAPPPSAVTTALSTVTQPTRSRVIRTWIGTSRGDNGKTRVTFVWEPTPSPPGDRNPREAPSRVMLTAAAENTPYFRGAASLGVTFDANPGKMQVRISVEGESHQVLDTETREIAVPDLTGQTAMATPELLRARTVRELQQLKGDAGAVPYAGREFQRTDRLLIRVRAYGPADRTPTLSVHLLNRAGQAMSELPVSPSTIPGAQQVELPLAGLAVGEYLVEIKSTAGADNTETKELIGFRVTG